MTAAKTSAKSLTATVTAAAATVTELQAQLDGLLAQQAQCADDLSAHLEATPLGGDYREHASKGAGLAAEQAYLSKVIPSTEAKLAEAIGVHRDAVLDRLHADLEGHPGRARLTAGDVAKVKAKLHEGFAEVTEPRNAYRAAVTAAVGVAKSKGGAADAAKYGEPRPSGRAVVGRHAASIPPGSLVIDGDQYTAPAGIELEGWSLLLADVPDDIVKAIADARRRR